MSLLNFGVIIKLFNGMGSDFQLTRLEFELSVAPEYMLAVIEYVLGHLKSENLNTLTKSFCLFVLFCFQPVFF